MSHPGNIDHQRGLEWPMIGALGALMAIGTAFIYSAANAQMADAGQVWYQQFHVKQVVSYVLGLICAMAVCLVEYRVIARWSAVLYWFAIFLLLLVLVIGDEVYGAARWLDLGFFKLQPSELAKIAVICFAANFLSRPVDELHLPGVLVRGLALFALPFGLILIEPDLGSALVLVPVGLGMMFIAGVPRIFLVKLVGGAAVVIALVLVDVLWAPKNWQLVKLEEYQKNRLKVYFGMDFAPKNADAEQLARARRDKSKYSYNVVQALICVGSGGMTGKGWGNGTQNALGYLPRAVAHNDFIFSVIAEETGFVGSMTVIALYGVILFSGLRIAAQSRDRLGKTLAVGVVAMWFSHIFINIGMNIRIVPVTGIPLPLLSYGGSAVLSSLIAAGLLQNIYIYRRNY